MIFLCADAAPMRSIRNLDKGLREIRISRVTGLPTLGLVEDCVYALVGKTVPRAGDWAQPLVGMFSNFRKCVTSVLGFDQIEPRVE